MLRSTKLPVLALLTLLPLGALSGCGGGNIPNTDVPDTSENREVVQFVEQYRQAIERRDVARLLQLASRRYFDDNGTPGGLDDIDFDILSVQLARWREQVVDTRYDIRYRRITFDRDKVLVDYTYAGSFRVSTPEGDRWARRLSDNRLVLTREEGDFRILSGM